jgi:hypothetical protein
MAVSRLRFWWHDGHVADYTGEYFSEELSTTYRFRVKDAALWLRVGGRRWERLDPTVRDEFVSHRRHWHENRIIRFRRGETGEVIGLTISFWRVKGVDFERK